MELDKEKNLIVSSPVMSEMTKVEAILKNEMERILWIILLNTWKAVPIIKKSAFSASDVRESLPTKCLKNTAHAAP